MTIDGIEIIETSQDTISAAHLSSLTATANLVDLESTEEDPPMPEAMVLCDLHPGGRFYHWRTWLAVRGEDVLGFAQIDGSEGEEKSSDCNIVLGVHPEHRRNGIAKALLDRARSEAHKDGRTKLLAWAPIDDDNQHFWRDVGGLELKADERLSRLKMTDTDPTLMAAWITQAEERASGYRLERWQGACPDHLLAAQVQVRDAMNDAPTDDLDVARSVVDDERMRDLEFIRDVHGLDSWCVMAVENETGDGAGYTNLQVVRHRPAVSWQNDTVTVEAHRNRGIGRWLKAAMWQWVRDERPDIEVLITGNAESNDAMLAINTAMGFTPHHNFGTWQGPTNPLDE